MHYHTGYSSSSVREGGDGWYQTIQLRSRLMVGCGGTMKWNQRPSPLKWIRRILKQMCFSFIFSTKGAEKIIQYLCSWTRSVLVSFPTGGFTNQAFLSCNTNTTGNLSPTYVSTLLVANHEMLKSHWLQWASDVKAPISYFGPINPINPINPNR